ncbi:CPBP family intramembrane glutamic endopeptidase [Pedobacter punctiformis]|uniref:Type II CAAX endopeptidase family protein n=1 Tax=Pedobacter punctiformis TaxID=3004097 RepID=A0ABT4L7G6_9SPHI|nr:type II CAAX endopeptidase family protein [Pedobacter sp. HCMS5-2]MCZ4243860.1 type II CAAX endopeptidase family protein [Pedobacter sp. HCMS5-2]
MEDTENLTKVCHNCQSEILTSNHYCNYCGQTQNAEEIETAGFKWSNLQQLALFFVVQVLLCITPAIIKENSIFFNLSLDVVMAITTLIFFGYSWAENKYLLKWPAFSLKKLLLFIVIASLASVIVQYLVTHLNLILWNKTQSYYDTFSGHPYGKYLMILSIAIFPALFEELAYRGYLMQKLINIFDEKQAIYISSFIFFIMHFSLISFFWLLPFAITLGFIRIREKTIWYGVIIHFIFNLTACLYELVDYDELQHLLNSLQ